MSTHAERRSDIRGRLSEFEDIWNTGGDSDLWEEMVYCFFTGGCSAKMGMRSIEAVRPLLLDGTQPELAKAATNKAGISMLRSVHRQIALRLVPVRTFWLGSDVWSVMCHR